ncbi:hypothetical protein [Fulvivirga lutea]|uniref:DUF3575 domain-containing protein n=1 Tax=Fulvivirga lutea TaxID=2810512 RepID=A0A974WH74_9BACT|nr:hypothetical protein [Fulvivirga lutea]QSE98458.1 hypothetical protein JR347_05105 [Fulvivirga lutea]
MEKKILWMGIACFLACNISTNAQYAKQDGDFKNHFVGSTMFLLGNLASTNSPEFVQLNLGYRITGKDVISVELITWKYAWPLGINPFYDNSYGKPEEEFPGYIREYGIGLAYQRYFWKGLYAAVHLIPMWQKFKDENGNKLENGFHLFNTYRIGYHVKLFKDQFFIEPSFGVAGRPYYTEMPDGFKQKDDKWPKWTPEPGLHIGFNF